MSSDTLGRAGDLMGSSGDAVIVVSGRAVVGWSPGAAQLFGVSRDVALGPGPVPLADHLDQLLALPADGTAERMSLPPYGVMEVRRRQVGAHQLIMVRDVDDEERRRSGLRRLSRLSRGLLAAETPSVESVLHAVCSEARAMTGAAGSAVLLLHDARSGEPAHLAVEGEAGALPELRFRGLLAVPVRTRAVVRRPGSPDQPPSGPLCAVPLVAGPEVVGELVIGRPTGTRPFDAVDEELVVDLAAHAAVAIRWAQGAEREREQARLRAEVVSTARHDIRSPLAVGKGYATLLQSKWERLSREQVAGALDALRQSFERIEQFTNSLLVDEQLEVTGVEPQWAVVPIAPLLDDVRRGAAVVAGRDDAVLVTLPPGAPQALAGDPVMVREVVDNLVGNALKHGDPSRPVSVAAVRDGDLVRLEVHDEGPGIAEEDQGLLFERWSRSERARRTGTAGFGLGLSIVKRLVTAHGGSVGVRSRPGEGATFWVTFPAGLAAS